MQPAPGCLPRLFAALVFAQPGLRLLPQQGPQAVNISGQHRQCHVTPEALNAMVRTHIQTVHF